MIWELDGVAPELGRDVWIAPDAQLIGRVVGKIREWGEQGGYFASEEDARPTGDAELEAYNRHLAGLSRED